MNTRRDIADATGEDLSQDANRPSRAQEIARSTDVSPRVGGVNVPPTLAAPTPDQVLEVVLALSRRVGVDMRPEEIARTYADAVERLLPHRSLLVYACDEDTTQLQLIHSARPPVDPSPRAVEITRSAARHHDVASVENGVVLLDAYKCVLPGSGFGFDVPLVEAQRVFGLVCVEYPDGVTELPGDRALIVPLVLQLGALLRNARLFRESVYLRDYLSKLLDHANAPIVVLGEGRTIRVANRAFLATLGMRRNDVLGEDILHLLPESERALLLPVLIAALRGEPTSNVEVRLQRRTGGYARLALNTASILDANGDIDGVIAIGRDLTEVRELEEQVIHAEKLATLGQLAAGVVHELNNPLTSISVYSDYLLHKSERAGADPADLEKLRRIGESAERILRFTRDLVAYARPSTEDPHFLSLADVLDQSIVFCEHVLQDTGAQVARVYDDEAPLVYGVKGQLHQVFINLITNACHAMPDGAGKLIVRLSRGDGARLRVAIEDNGRGIPSDHRERIFDPFFSTKGEGKGTGLGLSIVRNIVEQHRGQIAVESDVGRGTKFIVELPCKPVTSPT